MATNKKLCPTLLGFPMAAAVLGACPLLAADLADQTNGPNASAGNLTEIVVTAQKKSENLLQTAVPVSVISAESLVNTNQTGLQDYYNQVPGLDYAQAGFGGALVAIRGITAGVNQNPTVGFFLDDVPLGASTGNGTYGLTPYINPADLASIEVLRGPQGTLYGATGLGGIVRFITADPSTESFFGNIQAGTDTIRNAGNLGYNVNGAVNIPVNDAVAVRASAYVRSEPGYIDNIQTGQSGVNSEKAWGGHFIGLWQISSDFSLKIGALFQTDRWDGTSYGDVPTTGFPPAGVPAGAKLTDALQQIGAPGTGGFDQTLQEYTATLKGKIGDIDLIAISGYGVTQYHADVDYTEQFGAVAAFFSNPTVNGAVLIDDPVTHKFTRPSF
jgi:iron complex outermembrane receptor protein